MLWHILWEIKEFPILHVFRILVREKYKDSNIHHSSNIYWGIKVITHVTKTLRGKGKSAYRVVQRSGVLQKWRDSNVGVIAMEGHASFRILSETIRIRKSLIKGQIAFSDILNISKS